MARCRTSCRCSVPSALVDGLENAGEGMTTPEEVLRLMDESEMEDIAG